MKILIASDSFKGSLTSKQVANIMTKAIHEMNPKIEVLSVPIADGREGSVQGRRHRWHADEHGKRCSGLENDRLP